MEEIGLISKYIDQYGPLIVILAIFLCIFFAVTLYLLNTNKKTIASNTEMANTMTRLLEQQLKNNPNPQKRYDERNIVNIFMELNRTLKNVCERTMKQSKSDRTAVYVFHNGTHSAHGLPFFKLTCICETISKNSNANCKIENHSAIPLNMFEEIMDNLYNNSEYRITESSTNPGDLIFIRGTKIKDTFFLPIYDDDNNMMGFVTNSYNTTNNERIVEKEHDYLVDLAIKVRPVIEFSKFQEYQSNKEE